jgi:hypothetical protein
MKTSINNQELNVESVEDLGLLLDRIDSFKHAEVWINSENGSSICLLKSLDFTFLMYLESQDHTSLVSHSKSDTQGNIDFLLANGQIDVYPLIWCIDKEYAYKGLAYFFVNSGEKSPYINWVET